MKIKIPDWVNIYNYRTMTDEKKEKAVNGSKKFHYEWMIEEINEFYETLSNLEMKLLVLFKHISNLWDRSVFVNCRKK